MSAQSQRGRRKRLIRRRPGLRLPRHRATTAHVSALYPFHADPGLGPRGSTSARTLRRRIVLVLRPVPALHRRRHHQRQHPRARHGRVRQVVRRQDAPLPDRSGSSVRTANPGGAQFSTRRASTAHWPSPRAQTARLFPGRPNRLNPLDAGPHTPTRMTCDARTQMVARARGLGAAPRAVTARRRCARLGDRHRLRLRDERPNPPRRRRPAGRRPTDCDAATSAEADLAISPETIADVRTGSANSSTDSCEGCSTDPPRSISTGPAEE